MDLFPCPCSGENQRCFRCEGTGLLPQAALSVGRPHRNLAQAAINQEAKARESRKKRKRRDQKQVGGQSARAGKISLNGTAKSIQISAPSYKKCPHCGKVMRSKQLKQHILKVHGIGLSVAIPDINLSASKQLCICPLCGVEVIKLEKHFKKVHSSTSENQATTAPSVHSREKSQQARVIIDRHTDSLVNRSDSIYSGISGRKGAQMDAKFGWGGSFRDHGAFGSYPSHDAMDDESSP